MEHQEDNVRSTEKAKEEAEERARKDMHDAMQRMIEAERNSPEHTLESHTVLLKEWKGKYRVPNK